MAAAVSSAPRNAVRLSPATPLAVEPLADEAAHERLAQIADYYQARKDALDKDGGGAPYKPLPPDRLYLAEGEWRERLDASPLARLTPFAAPQPAADVIDIGAHAGHNFAAERATPGANVFEARDQARRRAAIVRQAVVIALWSEGSRERMAHVLAEHGLLNLAPVASWPAALRCRGHRSRSRCSASNPASRPPTSR